jgi:DNA-binding transcriptional MerR regulator
MEARAFAIAAESAHSTIGTTLNSPAPSVKSVRSAGNQCQYPRDVLRRVVFIRVAQRVGISLAEIAAALETLPAGRTPYRSDWARLSSSWRASFDQRIAQLREDPARCTGRLHRLWVPVDQPLSPAQSVGYGRRTGAGRLAVAAQVDLGRRIDEMNCGPTGSSVLPKAFSEVSGDTGCSLHDGPLGSNCSSRRSQLRRRKVRGAR